MDLPLFKLTRTYENPARTGTGNLSECTVSASVDDVAVQTGVETLAGKVLKFLLTYRGTDAFDTDYGGTALHWHNYSPSLMGAFQMELQDDIDRCCAWIRGSESATVSAGERLRSITLNGITYSREVDPTTLGVHLTVVATDGRTAQLHLSPTRA